MKTILVSLFNALLFSMITALYFDYEVFEGLILSFVLNIHTFVVIYLARKGYKKDVTEVKQ